MGDLLGFNEEVGMEVDGLEVEDMEVVMVEREEEEERENGSESEVVKFEKLMPRMVLRVLLVEADDSTRQIIAALLRKCNYKVAAISDGLKAWEILKRKHNNIDLILTELDLPSISGYALLTLIMEHDDCKNIPVIITSSQDSISMVLKCMLKGAADFLIKPVRRNELKNLWRHVWKRLAMNVHNTQNGTTGQCKVEGSFENHPASNHSSDNVSSCRKNRKCSEKASDAKELSQIKNREETYLLHKEMKHHDNNIKSENELAMDTNVLRQLETRVASEGVRPELESTALEVVEDGSCTGIATKDGSRFPENNRLNDGHRLLEPSGEAIDLIDGINNQKWESSASRRLNTLNSTTELELSLRRFHDTEAKEVDEGPMLNHSTASAFSRYSSNKKSCTTSSINDLTEIKGAADISAWPKAFNSNRDNKPDILAGQSGSGEAVSPRPQSGLARPSDVMFDSGAWTSYGPMFQPVFSQLTGPTARSPSCAFQREESPFLTKPSLYPDPSTPSSTQGCGALGETTDNSSRQAGHEPDNRESVERRGYSNSPAVDQSGSSNPWNEIAVQHKSNGYGSLSEVTDVSAQQKSGSTNPYVEFSAHGKSSGYGSLSEVTDVSAQHKSGSSTPCNAFAAQHKSSGYGSFSEVTDVSANADDVKGTSSAIEESVRNDGIDTFDHDQFPSRTGIHSAEREAALAKFRLKRKGRCFEKKVRYQSRKRLAEQRPRVKGQFVRQGPADQVLVDVDKS